MRNITYFVSDLHLGASYITDSRSHELAIVKWLKEIAPTARRLFLLGDVLDYWYEYREVVPRGFVRFFGTLAELADSGVEVVWLKGNHDIWIFDYLPTELGITVVDGSLVRDIDGCRFFMEHGDGVGRMPAGFKRLRSLFRNRMAQRLFAAIHPRWTVRFAHRWSSHSRKTGSNSPECLRPDDPLIEFAEQYMSEHGHVDYFVFGHRHIAADCKIGENGSRLIFLGDGFRNFTYGIFDGNNFKLKHMFEDGQLVINSI